MSRKVEEKKNALIILIVLLVLMSTVAVLAHLNRGDLQQKRDLESNQAFLLARGESEYRIAMDDILELSPKDFTAVMKTSGTEPTPTNFTGVELNTLFAKYDIPIEAESTVQVTALDGYTSIISGSEVLAADNVYLCIAMDGEVLRSKNEGGLGPYLVVIKDAPFAQRWCKYVEKIAVTQGIGGES